MRNWPQAWAARPVTAADVTGPRDAASGPFSRQAAGTGTARKLLTARKCRFRDGSLGCSE